MNVAMKQAMNMTPEQREEVLKLGQQLFGSRKRRVTETPDEATLKEDKNIEFVSEEKKPSPNATKEGEENVIYVEPTSTSTKEDKKKEKKEDKKKEEKDDKKEEDAEPEIDFVELPNMGNIMEQFRTMLRENGIFSMFDVDDVRFETNGRITISRRNEPPESYLLVNGGKVMEDALKRSGKGKRWLLRHLRQAGYPDAEKLFCVEWTPGRGFYIVPLEEPDGRDAAKVPLSAD